MQQRRLKSFLFINVTSSSQPPPNSDNYHNVHSDTNGPHNSKKLRLRQRGQHTREASFPLGRWVDRRERLRGVAVPDCADKDLLLREAARASAAVRLSAPTA
eukprot:6183294-Pleurochrysis_carterae.AAC.3